MKLKLNQLQELCGPTAGTHCFPQVPGMQVGAHPSSFAVTRGAAHWTDSPKPSASGPQVQQISFGIHGWIFPSDSMWTPEPGVALRGRSSLQVLQKLVLLCHLTWGSVSLLQDDTGTCEQRQTVLLELFLVNNMEIEIGNTSREWDYANSKIGLI